MNFLTLLIAAALTFLPATLVVASDEILTVGVKAFPKEHDVAFSRAAYATVLLEPLHRGLVHADKHGFLSSDLAVRWEFSQDRKRYSFCTPVFRFNNGEKVALDDIAYSFKRFWDGSRTSVHSWIYDKIRPEVVRYAGSNPSFKHENEICFDVLLRVPYFGFLTLVSSPIFSIVSRHNTDSILSAVGKFCRSSLNALHSEYVECSASSLAQRKIVLQLVPDDLSAAQLISSGKMDMYIGVTDLGGAKLQNFEPKGYEVSYLNDLGISGLFFNTQIPMFQNKEFRGDFSRMIQEIVRRNRTTLSPALSYSPYIVPDGLLTPAYYRRPSTENALEYFVEKWKGKFPASSFDVVSRYNLLGGKPIDDLKVVLERIGLNLVYISESSGESVERIRSGRYHVVFYSWMASTDRVDEFFAMVGTLLGPKSEEFPKIAGHLDSISRLFKIKNYDERIREFERILMQVEQENLLVPLFKMKTPILHRPMISMPKSRWRYTPSISEFRNRKDQ